MINNILDSKKVKEHSIVSFGTGVLTGAAVSSLVPWEAITHFAPSLQLCLLASVCAGFVVFRLVLRHRTLRRTGGVVCIVAGGFLMSSGQHFGSGHLTSSLIPVGAGAFLCGLTILLRERLPDPTARKEAIERLLEADEGPTTAKPVAMEPLEKVIDDRLYDPDLAALAEGVGVGQRADPSSIAGTKRLVRNGA